MDRVLNISTATVGSATSETLDLGDTANAAGTRPVVLRMDLGTFTIGGGFSSVLVEHSSDNSTWATLWNLGTLVSSSTYQYAYSFKRYLRVSWVYAAGGTTEDPGGRFRVRFRVFGLPDWEKAKVCRWDDCSNLRPSWFDTTAGFTPAYEEQRTAAKRRLETMLAGAGMEPSSLFTDGHATEPVPVGLARAGALCTLLMVHADAGVARSDAWKTEHEALEKEFQAAFELSVASGLMLSDRDGEGAADEDSAVVSTPRLGR